MHRKQKEYKKLSIENIYDVINIVNVNMEDDYIYNENTKIYIYDSVNETSAKLELSSSFIKKLNSAPKNMHSFLIDTYYKSVNENSTDSQSEDDDFLKNSDNYEDDVEYENDKEQDDEDEDDFLSD
jgi:NAD dependent epimerase/dehydratase family enzyme